MIKLRKQQRERVFDEAIKRWNTAFQVEERQRELMNEDTLFAHSQDGQWADLINGSSEDGRARFAVNKIASNLRAVYGNYIHIRPRAKLEPAGLGADKEMATTRTGLIRSIEANNQAFDIYDTAFKNIITSGFGAWKIKTGYADEDTFDQDIIMIPIPDAVNTVWFDPTAKRYDRRDGMYAFHVEHIPFDEFKIKYPKSKMADFSSIEKLIASKSCNSYWYNGDTVAVGQYWRKIPIKKEIGLLETGETVEVTAEIRESLQNGEGAELVKDESGNIRTRIVDCHRVEMYMINGMEVLGDGYEFPCKYIPIVPAFGEQVMVQGEKHIQGMVRFAKDPQRIYNYANSAFIESAAISPEQPYLIAAEQIDGYEEEWGSAGADLPPYLRYKHIDGVGMPQRATAPMANQTLISSMVQSENDIRATMGVISVGGERPQEISGKSFREQMKNNDLGTVVFTDNLKKSVQYSTEIINELLGVTYDSERVSRIIGEDGQSEEIVFNRVEYDNQGNEVKLNDLSVGKYQVTASAAPSYASQKSELLESLNNMSINNPEFVQLTSDFQAKLLDAPWADEFYDRVRRNQVMAGIVEPTDEEVEKYGINPQAMAQQKAATEQANQAYLLAEAQIKAAEAMKLNEEAANKAADTDKKVSENQAILVKNIAQAITNIKEKLSLGIPVDEMDLMLARGAQEIALDDMADSVQERQELESAMAQQMSAQQAAQQVQATQPIAPNAEQSVQINQMKDLQY